MRKFIVAILVVLLCDTLALALVLLPNSPLAPYMGISSDTVTETVPPVQMSDLPEVTTEDVASTIISDPPETETTVPETTEPEITEPEHFTLTFVGNCTLGTAEKHFNYEHGFIQTIGENYRYPFANVVEYFENDDFTMLNLEGVLADEGKASNNQFTFRGPTAYVNILTENSVEAVSLANNHTMDFREEGYASTTSTLENAGVSYVEQDKTLVVTTESGLTIGIYAVHMDHLVEEEIVAAVSQLAADESIDLVIFSAHWGQENSFRANATQKQLAYAAIDAGANIVYGTHPYTLQPIEAYNGGIIYYSLGNFASGSNNNPKDFNTALVQQEVIRDADGTVTLGQLTLVPCSVSSITRQNNFQPIPYEAGTEGYEKTLAKLNGTHPASSLSN